MPNRRILVSIPDEKVQATALLLDEQAPATCRALWGQLDSPLEVAATHAMWTGPEISMQVPPDLAHRVLSEIPPENQTVMPPAGALVWAYLPEFAWAGSPAPLYDIGLFYRPGGRIFLPVGWVPCNHFASLEGEWSGFEEACSRFLSEGRKRVRLERFIQD